MIGSYAIVVDHGPPRGESGALERRDAFERHGLDVIFERPGLVVTASAATPVMLGASGSWMAIGRVFDRAGDALPYRASEDLTGLNDLLARTWGGYVAFEVSRDERIARVLRDPSGAQPCWMVRSPASTVFSNDVRLGLTVAGRPQPAIHRESLAQALLFPDLRGPATAMEGIDEVQPGTARSAPIATGAWTTETRWSPWHFTPAAERVDDPDQAAELVRRGVDEATRAWSKTLDRPLVELSGGLDSSIVAAAIAAAGKPLLAMTLVTPGPDGDERRYAEAVATSLGGTLREVHATADMIDLHRSASGHLPRPAARGFAQAGDRLALQTAEAMGADGFLSGGGGDNVFAYYYSALPAADRLRAAGPGIGALATVVDAARLMRRSVWQTGRRAIERAWIDRSLPLWQRDPSLLSADVASLGMPDHPWLKPPRNSLPGKHWHVRQLVTIQNHIEGFARGGLPIVFPLLAQPLMEAALRIPSWLWIDGGRDRAVARRAFRDRLPQIIIERRTKGGLDSLAEAVVGQHHAVLSDMLLDGWLAASGIIDRPAVEKALSASRLSGRLRLLALADVEAWARCWR